MTDSRLDSSLGFWSGWRRYALALGALIFLFALLFWAFAELNRHNKDIQTGGNNSPFWRIGEVETAMRTSMFRPKNLLGCWIFRIFHDLLFLSIPSAPSRSNHYVTRLVGTIKFSSVPYIPPTLPPESKRVHFCPSVSALLAQSRGLKEQSDKRGPCQECPTPKSEWRVFQHKRKAPVSN